MSWRMILALGLAVLSANIVAAAGQAPDRPQADVADEGARETSQDASRKLYVVVFDKGPAFAEEGPQPAMGEHVPFIKGLYADGVVPLAGALFGDGEQPAIEGLLYFVRAATLEEARALVMTEPLVEAGVVEIESIRMFMAGVGSLD